MPTGAQLNTQWDANHLNCVILGNEEPRGDFSNRMDALCLAAVTGPGFCDPTDVRILPMKSLCMLPLSGPTKQYMYLAYASGEAHLLSLENQIILPTMRVCSCIPALQLSDKLRMCIIELLRSLRAEKALTWPIVCSGVASSLCCWRHFYLFSLWGASRVWQAADSDLRPKWAQAEVPQ